MDPLFEALERAPSYDTGLFRPVLFRASDPSDRAALLALLGNDPGIKVHDRLLDQLIELVRSLNPGIRSTRPELEQAARDHLKGIPIEHYGVWVHYPWSHRLVHILDEAEFALVRTDRNRNKITRTEQARLSTKKVGVIGLSVGQSISLTMALERSFGEIRLADHDTLELSNLNRIRSGVHELGLSKVINTAREIAELDPYLQVTCFTDGITRGNMDRFLSEGGKIDVLVEECDSVDVKLFARQRARAHGIPVIMDTSDRGMLDIERFDLEPDRPILHGLVDHLDLDAAAKARTAEEKLPFILPIAGIAELSKRMKASMLEVENSIVTWPQLANSVMHGGAVGADHYRRIALGEPVPSGRWYMEKVIPRGSHGNPVDRSDALVEDHAPQEITLDDMLARSISHPEARGLDPNDARLMCEAGSLAPSAGNMQPWRFLYTDGAIHLFHAHPPERLVMNAGGMISAIDMACCIENMVLKAAELGIALHVDVLPVASDPQYVAAITVREGAVPPSKDALVELIQDRCTNRHRYNGDPLPMRALEDMALATAMIEGCQAHFVQDPSSIATVADIVGRAEQLRMLDPEGHGELFNREIRWTPEDAARTRDGLDLDSFELKATERVGLSVAADPEAIALLREWKAGSGFQDISGDPIRTSSAVVLISSASDDLNGIIAGGRALQRCWLSATRSGIAAHPIAAPILLASHARSMVQQGHNNAESAEMVDLGNRIKELFAIGDGIAVFMLRLGFAPPPTSTALRRPLENMFHIVEKVSA